MVKDSARSLKNGDGTEAFFCTTTTSSLVRGDGYRLNAKAEGLAVGSQIPGRRRTSLSHATRIAVRTRVDVARQVVQHLQG